MKRHIVIIVIAALAIYFFSSFLNRQDVTVIDAHYDGHTAQIIVDRLPFSKSAKIDWWLSNQGKIRSKYRIPSGNKGPFLIAVFAFGEGYQEEGKEDRLCFNDIKPPRNCIDKNILMTIWRTRDGGVKYEF
ncbi:DUF943 family protein [Erwinia sp. BNK-24-b]|uniref:DUF943 family protein n=1 Tax=unclassified Erwinia TaxID=2622719 RepID=UPI0039BF4E9C